MKNIHLWLDLNKVIEQNEVKKIKQTRIEECWGLKLRHVYTNKSKNVSLKKPKSNLKQKLKPSPGNKNSNFKKNLSFFRQQETLSGLELAVSGKKMLEKFGNISTTSNSNSKSKPKLNTLPKPITDRILDNGSLKTYPN